MMAALARIELVLAVGSYALQWHLGPLMPPTLGDFREQGAHLDELMRHRRIVDARSVFAKVAAEVAGETFELSQH